LDLKSVVWMERMTVEHLGVHWAANSGLSLVDLLVVV
jgi:hypothetical protein